MNSFDTVGVIGAGTMGTGIAQVCAAAGLAVLLLDVSPQTVERAMTVLNGNLDRLVKKVKLSPGDVTAILKRVRGTTDRAELANAKVVIESATENLQLKLQILRDVEAIVAPGTVIASNTSSISITQMAAVLNRPADFIGLHFFNPVPQMSLVEVIPGIQTGEKARELAVALAKVLGKTPVTVKNSPGFIVNRLLCPMINEAIFALQEGLASAEEIDAAMRLGCSHPVGPLALADIVGLDTLLAIMEILSREFGDTKYRPARLLKELVHAGRLGRKSGAGIFNY